MKAPALREPQATVGIALAAPAGPLALGGLVNCNRLNAEDAEETLRRRGAERAVNGSTPQLETCFTAELDGGCYGQRKGDSLGRFRSPSAPSNTRTLFVGDDLRTSLLAFRGSV